MHNKLAHCLLFLRLSVALVLIMWTIDKFVNPAHATGVFAHFYFIPGIEGSLMMMVAAAEVLLIALFVAGRYKKVTYLLVLIIHTVSTLTPYAHYLDPFKTPNLLFFAAWPMLAACYALYVLRDEDTKLNF
ncbi:MAG: putative oxidoreductase [Cryomorphaceae bacterium]|jgi:putative oxidoreductase